MKRKKKKRKIIEEEKLYFEQEEPVKKRKSKDCFNSFSIYIIYWCNLCNIIYSNELHNA